VALTAALAAAVASGDLDLVSRIVDELRARRLASAVAAGGVVDLSARRQ
jgi:hypothetical protein